MEKEINKANKKESIIQFIKFTFFSISAGLVEIASFSILNELTNLFYWPKYLIALTLSVVYNFTVNRRFTFKSANNVPIAMIKVIAFYCVFTPVSAIAGEYLSQVGWNEYLILGLTMVTNFVTEFFYAKYVVFRNSINTNDLANKELT